MDVASVLRAVTLQRGPQILEPEGTELLRSQYNGAAKVPFQLTQAEENALAARSSMPVIVTKVGTQPQRGAPLGVSAQHVMLGVATRILLSIRKVVIDRKMVDVSELRPPSLLIVDPHPMFYESFRRVEGVDWLFTDPVTRSLLVHRMHADPPVGAVYHIDMFMLKGRGAPKHYNMWFYANFQRPLDAERAAELYAMTGAQQSLVAVFLPTRAVFSDAPVPEFMRVNEVLGENYSDFHRVSSDYDHGLSDHVMAEIQDRLDDLSVEICAARSRGYLGRMDYDGISVKFSDKDTPGPLLDAAANLMVATSKLAGTFSDLPDHFYVHCKRLWDWYHDHNKTRYSYTFVSETGSHVEGYQVDPVTCSDWAAPGCSVPATYWNRSYGSTKKYDKEYYFFTRTGRRLLGDENTAFCEQTIQWVNSSEAHCLYHHLVHTTRIYERATLRGWYQLPQADAYRPVLDFKASLARYNGHFKDLKYVGVPMQLLEKTMQYVQSLHPKNIVDLSEAVPNVASYMRKDAATVAYSSNVTILSSGRLKADDYHTVALSILLWMHEGARLMSEAQSVVKSNTIMERLRAAFGRTFIDGTFVEDLILFLTKHRWSEKIILPCPGTSAQVVRFEYVPPIRAMARRPPPPPPRPVLPPEVEISDPAPTAPEVSDESEPPVSDSPESSEHVEELNDCIVCGASRAVNYPGEHFECRHGTSSLILGLDSKEIYAAVGRFNNRVNAPQPIYALGRDVAPVLLDKYDIRCKVDLHMVVGLPGTGKSTLARAMIALLTEGNMDQVAVVVPFNELRKDYSSESLDHLGQELGTRVICKTQDHAVKPTTGFKSFKYVFVDECGSLPYEYLVMLSMHNPGCQMWLFGDPHQTQTREAVNANGDSEGINTFARFKVDYGVDWMEKMDVHILAANYRNPASAVKVANEIIRKQDASVGAKHVPMSCMTNSPKEIKFLIGEDALMEFESDESLLEPEDRARRLYFSKDAIGEDEPASSVRGSQGKTYKRVLLMCQQRYHALARMRDMMLVAVTRHTDDLIVYVEAPNSPAWQRWKNEFFSEYALDVRQHIDFDTHSSFLPTALEVEPTAALPFKQSDKRDANALLSPLYEGMINTDELEPLRFTAIEQVTIQPAIGPDAKQDLTARAGLPKNRDVEHVRILSSPYDFPMLGSAHFTNKTALKRQGSPENVEPMSVADAEIAKRLVRAYNDIVVGGLEMAIVNEEVEMQHLLRFLDDASSRKYLDRILGENKLGIMSEFNTKLIQRVNVKEGNKIQNVGKSVFLADLWKGVGQTIASLEVLPIARVAIAIRVLQWARSRSRECNYKYKDYSIFNVSNQHIDKFTEQIKQWSLETEFITKMYYGDGEKTDSGANQNTFSMLEDCDTDFVMRFNFDNITRAGIIQALAETKSTMYSMMMITPGLKFRTDWETPSGIPLTFHAADQGTALQWFAYFCPLHVAMSIFGSRDHNNYGGTNTIGCLGEGGDDKFTFGADMAPHPIAMQFFERVSGVKMRVVERSEGQMIAFCGLQFTIHEGRLFVSRDLIRKWLKTMSARFHRDESSVHHFGLVMKDLRDNWFRYEDPMSQEEKRIEIWMSRRMMEEVKQLFVALLAKEGIIADAPVLSDPEFLDAELWSLCHFSESDFWSYVEQRGRSNDFTVYSVLDQDTSSLL